MENETIKVKYFGDDLRRIEPNKKGDWIDLYASETVLLHKGEFKLIPLGVAMELPDGYEAHLAPRSSTFKNWGIIQTNSVGIIDYTYMGDNDMWKMPAFAVRDTVINKGDKICQFRIMKRQPQLTFNEVQHLNNSDRGGFGSTGKV